MFDFFVTEAKKRKLVSNRDYSLDSINVDRSYRSNASIYGVEVAQINRIKRSVQREPIYGKPINVMKVEKPTVQQLFHKHLKNLTSYEQRVKYGIGDDIESDHVSYARPNLEGLRYDQFRPKPK